MVMKNHPHPGELLLEEVRRRFGLDVAGAAKRLNVSCTMLSRVLDGRASISPDWRCTSSALDSVLHASG